jgi:hypothetical protein
MAVSYVLESNQDLPYFLRCFLAIPAVKRILRAKKHWTKISISDITEKTILLALYLWTLLYFGACAFMYFENRFPGGILISESGLSVIDTFYFVVITITTVGYGDITPSSAPGQIVIIIMIFSALVYLPGLIADMQSTFSIEASGAGSYTPGRHPFYVICGNFKELHRTMDIIRTILGNVVTYSPSTIHKMLMSCYFAEKKSHHWSDTV